MGFESIGDNLYNVHMIEIKGIDIWRGGQKIGWLDGYHIRAHDNKRLGYFESNYIYGENGHKLAYVAGDYLYSEGGNNNRIPLEKVNEEITGGVMDEIAKCAIYILLGD